MASKPIPNSSPTVPPKPVTDIWRPELTRLPSLHVARRLYRRLVRLLALLLLRLLTRTTISGLENFPAQAPALLATNHLGDADAVVLLAAFPISPEVLAKIEMLDFPVVGRIMDWYGMIWLHRGRPDRRALRSALEALQQGRSIVMAPEGRYTLVNGLELGGKGAAYLAVKAGVPVVPVALTGTGNRNVYSSLRRFRRPRITVALGEPIILKIGAVDRAALEADTQCIMQALAALLPADYRGAYR
jgi:1-acyl-sn-glycerol-3-phosphate acyltransferase